jgi:hypothetical protein
MPTQWVEGRVMGRGASTPFSAGRPTQAFRQAHTSRCTSGTATRPARHKEEIASLCSH